MDAAISFQVDLTNPWWPYQPTMTLPTHDDLTNPKILVYDLTNPGRVGRLTSQFFWWLVLKHPGAATSSKDLGGQQHLGEKLLGVTWNLFAPRIQHISYYIYIPKCGAFGLWGKACFLDFLVWSLYCVPMYAMPGDRFIARALNSLSQLNNWSFRQMISPYLSIWARSEAMNRFRVKEGTEDQFEQRWGKDRSIASCLTQRKKSEHSIVVSLKDVSNPHCLVT